MFDCTEKEIIVLESNQNHATAKADSLSPTLPASMGLGGGYVPMIAYAVHEASGQDVTLGDVAYSLVTRGGKPGQGFPCVIIIKERHEVLRTNSRPSNTEVY